ncbi:hypothetical protein RV11_GL001127 [Enterococcus phoeniculicola]|nr:hypothetical protein RV11_GL001127 [Enterococcus phoeniculicola]
MGLVPFYHQVAGRGEFVHSKNWYFLLIGLNHYQWIHTWKTWLAEKR